MEELLFLISAELVDLAIFLFSFSKVAAGERDNKKGMHWYYLNLALYPGSSSDQYQKF